MSRTPEKSYFEYADVKRYYDLQEVLRELDPAAQKQPEEPVQSPPIRKFRSAKLYRKQKKRSQKAPQARQDYSHEHPPVIFRDGQAILPYDPLDRDPDIYTFTPSAEHPGKVEVTSDNPEYPVADEDTLLSDPRLGFIYSDLASLPDAPDDSPVGSTPDETAS